MPGERAPHIILDLFRHHDHAGPAVRRVWPARREAALLQAIHDAGDRAVRQSHAAAELLQAQPAAMKQGLHYAALRRGQVSPGELRIDRLAQNLADRAQVLFDLSRHSGQPLFVSHIPVQSYSTNGMSALTSRW